MKKYPKLNLRNYDCMDLMSEYADNYFELAIVDPPYGIPEAFKGGFLSKSKNRAARPFAKNMKNWDIKPEPKYFKELFRVSKNQIIFGGNYFDLPPTRGIIAWIKPEQYKGNHPFFSHFEYIWTSFKKPAKVFEHTTLEIGVPRIHSTQKPVALYKWLLQNYAKKDDKILDTHGGSMSIAVACWDAGFDLTACELDKDYYDDAIERIERHKQQLFLF